MTEPTAGLFLPMTEPTGGLPDRLLSRAEVIENMTEQYLSARDRRDEAVEQIARLEEILIQLIGAGGTSEIAPGTGVRVLAGQRRFSVDMARRNLEQDALDLICTPVPTATLARLKLPERIDDWSLLTRPSVRLLQPS